MVTSWILPVVEWIGAFSFAISGSLVAIGHGLDLFGVLMVGTITTFGGGILRDLLLGNTPPLIFYHSDTLLFAFLTSFFVFLYILFPVNRFSRIKHRIGKVNLLFDSLGLGAFSVAGVQIACDCGFGDQFVLSVLMGCVTGCGGGVIRDLLVNVKPYVFTKHVYAVASLLGSAIYYVIVRYTSYSVSGSFFSLFIVVIIRFLAALFRWELPKISNTNLKE